MLMTITESCLPQPHSIQYITTGGRGIGLGRSSEGRALPFPLYDSIEIVLLVVGRIVIDCRGQQASRQTKQYAFLNSERKGRVRVPI